MAQRHLKDFSRREIKEIATKYALSPLDVTHSFFESEYGISKATFYNILKTATVKGIVEENIVRKMSYKAQASSSIKAGNAGAERSRRHYRYLMEDRKFFEFTDEEKIKITVEYSQSSLPKRKFANENAIAVDLLERTLYFALTKKLVDDETFEAIRKKALKNHRTNQNVIAFWKKIENLRNNNRQA